MSDRRKMKFKLIHAASSGIVIALVLSLVLIPSIWEISGQLQPAQLTTLEEKGGRSAAEDSGVTPLPAPPPEPPMVTSRPPMLGIETIVGSILSIIVVAVVLFSFLLIRRVEE